MTIKLVILFGSHAAGEAGKRSDTDIAVLADHPLDLDDRGGIAEKMAKRLSVTEDDIDIVDLWSASPLLQHEVAEKGKLLEGDDYDFLRFRVLAWKRYQDTAKFRRVRERALARKHE